MPVRYAVGFSGHGRAGAIEEWLPGQALLVAALGAALGGCSSGGGTIIVAQGGTDSVAGAGASAAVTPGTGGATSSSGGTNDSSATGGVDSVGTGGTGNLTGLDLYGTCYPVCASAASDDDGDGWGWENEASCLVAGSEAAEPGTPCDPGGSPATGGSPAAGGTTGSGGSSSTTTSCSTTGGGTCPSSFTCHDGSQPGPDTCGCYSVSGLGDRKAAILDSGARQALNSALVQYMLASAMMETEGFSTDYPYGDNKTGGSSCWGLCKQNWDMLRECHPPWNSLGQGDYATGAQLNSDLDLDVLVYAECREYYGDLWWAGHRNGWAGLHQDSNTPDIQNFKAAMDWSDRMLAGHECDDLRFWANVQPIIIR
jgi:hypothetical protein